MLSLSELVTQVLLLIAIVAVVAPGYVFTQANRRAKNITKEYSTSLDLIISNILPSVLLSVFFNFVVFVILAVLGVLVFIASLFLSFSFSVIIDWLVNTFTSPVGLSGITELSPLAILVAVVYTSVAVIISYGLGHWFGNFNSKDTHVYQNVFDRLDPNDKSILPYRPDVEVQLRNGIRWTGTLYNVTPKNDKNGAYNLILLDAIRHVREQRDVSSRQDPLQSQPSLGLDQILVKDDTASRDIVFIRSEEIESLSRIPGSFQYNYWKTIFPSLLHLVILPRWKYCIKPYKSDEPHGAHLQPHGVVLWRPYLLRMLNIYKHIEDSEPAKWTRPRWLPESIIPNWHRSTVPYEKSTAGKLNVFQVQLEDDFEEIDRPQPLRTLKFIFPRWWKCCKPKKTDASTNQAQATNS